MQDHALLRDLEMCNKKGDTRDARVLVPVSVQSHLKLQYKMDISILKYVPLSFLLSTSKLLLKRTFELFLTRELQYA
jgi:hypothetical protein